MMTGESIGDISVIKRTREKANNERSRSALSRLEEIYEALKLFGNEKYVSFDLGILSKYNYYTGVIFKGYTYGIGDVIVKGGRYDNLVEAFGNPKPAIGFMIVVDDLLMALRGQKINIPVKEKPMIVTYNDKNRNEKIKEVIELRKNGKAVSLIKEDK